MLDGKQGDLLMPLPVFEDASGHKIAVNPAQVVTVVRIDAQSTDINVVGGGIVRVSVSFDNVLSRLLGQPELAPS
jgi:hypothetical protein